MNEDKEKPPEKITLKIGKLSRYSRPKTGPEDQPPVSLVITNLTLTRSGGAEAPPSPPNPEPETPENKTLAAPPAPLNALIAKLIPLWADPKARRWLLRKVFLPAFAALLILALALLAASGA